MKDPFDNRPDVYALLNCPESCTRADVQRAYTAQIVRRAAPQRDLQAARELLVRTDRRLLYDVLLYNLTQEVPDPEGHKPSELNPDAFLPLPTPGFGSARADPAAVAEHLELKRTSPQPADLNVLLQTDEPAPPDLPIEFDS